MSEDEIKSMCCDIYEGGEWKPMVEYILNLQTELKQEREKNKELEEKLKMSIAMLTKGTYPETEKGANDFDNYFVSKDKIRNFIKEETKEGTYDFATISAERLKELLERR